MERPKMLGFIGDLNALWNNPDRWNALVKQEHAVAHLHHVLGSQDPIVAVEKTKEYCDRYPFTSWSEIKEGGNLLQFSHPEQVVNRIKHMVFNDPALSLIHI